MIIALTVWLSVLIMSSLILAGYSENKVTCKKTFENRLGKSGWIQNLKTNKQIVIWGPWHPGGT